MAFVLSEQLKYLLAFLIGESSYLDFSSPHTRAWYSRCFGLDKYKVLILLYIPIYPFQNHYGWILLAHRKQSCRCWRVYVGCRDQHRPYLYGMIWTNRLCSTGQSRPCQRMQCIMGDGNTGNYTICTASTRWAGSFNLFQYRYDTKMVLL